MTIPEECTVLVVGGGPAGSYASSVLAREGIRTVMLEADTFPRYHIGESMLPSMRHFLQFIDLDEKFNQHGFRIKNGAFFKINSKPAAYTDFVASGGPGTHSWNIVRSEADQILFDHARESGATAFDGVKVTEIQFAPHPSSELGKPVSASWSRKDGSTGSIRFEYLLDASGRAGLVSTKYMKNRRFNQGLKNTATWGYWEGAGVHAVGTTREGDPYFEAIADGSGWVWTIALHNGTTSVGVVMNQAKYTERKKQNSSLCTSDLYNQIIQEAPVTRDLLAKARLISDLRSVSDWSYSASAYASPYLRIAGDAGCFIDPFFSSGVHLAMASGLSAAVTICASLRGDCDEEAAASWHTDKVSEGYTRFLLVVLSVLKQIENREEPVINDWDEKSFDRAFSMFRPIIQGTVKDSNSKLTQFELARTVDFCAHAFSDPKIPQQVSLLKKLRGLISQGENADALQKSLSPEELETLNGIRSRQMIRMEDVLRIDNFGHDVIDGMKPNLKRGALGLRKDVKDDGEGNSNPMAVLGLEDRPHGMQLLF
ncbi:FAD/NAD(P)-binding domain-containing protein [Aspergillus steynii IBT 23096]|uniref:FAD/NAD(P)-binding domain-containing protein n=1 Tax=Aspergillus steynii IBT 23096 TaxID=1392250 RepID=A0A2I2FYX2_9EURO|nr:FAD/NAD(P)-binding domain-containing protein [Aspergillus steynii IBT 23096]PLB45829.1 FAD/NAD(P)-binding domain-containing protein [Aspergillus steynii IBT 23096]